MLITLYSCYMCREFKKIEEMNRDRSKAHGVGNRCKPCAREYMRQYHQRRKENLLSLKNVVVDEEKTEPVKSRYVCMDLPDRTMDEHIFVTCRSCGKEKRRCFFPITPTSKSGRSLVCRQCEYERDHLLDMSGGVSLDSIENRELVIDKEADAFILSLVEDMRIISS